MLQCLREPVCCSVLQYVASCCSVLQCVAVCCNVLQYLREPVRVFVRERERGRERDSERERDVFEHVGVLTNMLNDIQCIAVHCSVLQRPMHSV